MLINGTIFISIVPYYGLVQDVGTISDFENRCFGGFGDSISAGLFEERA
jgi:hypothetical protein